MDFNKTEYIFKNRNNISYKVTREGQVLMSKNGVDWKEKAIKENKRTGYFYFKIGRQSYALHRIVATAFCEGKGTLDTTYNQLRDTVDHLRGKENNDAASLEWVCQRENNARYEQLKK